MLLTDVSNERVFYYHPDGRAPLNPNWALARNTKGERVGFWRYLANLKLGAIYCVTAQGTTTVPSGIHKTEDSLLAAGYIQGVPDDAAN